MFKDQVVVAFKLAVIQFGRMPPPEGSNQNPDSSFNVTLTKVMSIAQAKYICSTELH